MEQAFEKAFFENAQKIFDVARAGGGEEMSDFAILVRPDGGLHLIMESPVSLEAAALYGGVRTLYHVARTPLGVRVTGQTSGRTCVLEEAGKPSERFRLLRDQPLYQRFQAAEVVLRAEVRAVPALPLPAAAPRAE